MSSPPDGKKRLRVLVIGGYGVFGGRLVRLLKGDARLTVLVAGRSLAKAAGFCEQHRGGATFIPAVLDRDGVTPGQLQAHQPDLIVDASGPFQAYGEAPYRVIEAAIAIGVTYLDLADATDFVLGIARFDAQARERGISVISGASTCPALTGAVTRQLAEGLARVDTIHAGIAPSPYAGVGLNVVRAITAYAGKPLAIRRDGRAAMATALGDTMRTTIAPPGRLPLGNRLFSLVDVPDLTLLAKAWPTAQTVWIGAAPEPELWHRALTLLARLVRWRLLPPLGFAAPFFHRIIDTLRWGEARGGMFVSVEGTEPGGTRVVRSWHMIAEGDDGPFVPAMACAAIIARMLDERPPAPGARSALDALELQDFEGQFSRLAITTGVRSERAGDMATRPLYARLLGDAWMTLPSEIRAMHDMAGQASAVARGRGSVERGTGLTARLIAAVFRFPGAADDVPVSVMIDVRDGMETWRRDFGGTRFSSVQSQGRGRSQHLVDERFGPVSVGLAIVVEDGRLRLVPRRWTFLGVPMPRALMPSGDFHERVEDGRFRFDVTVNVPLAGFVVRYRGWLSAPERA